MRISWLALLIALVPAGAHAEEYRFGRDHARTGLTAPSGYEVSTGCLDHPKAICLALRAAAKATARERLAQSEPGGRNPGSLVCKDLGGKVTIGVDSSGDEQAFCLFEKDQSLISVDSLVIAGKANDAARR